MFDKEMSFEHVDYATRVTYDWCILCHPGDVAWLDIPVPVSVPATALYHQYRSVLLSDYIFAGTTPSRCTATPKRRAARPLEV
jgi:hypothetical protein